jgi:flavin-dependent dehydrogenase
MASHARALGVDFRDLTTVTQIQGSLDTTFDLNLRAQTGQDSIRARVVIGAYGKRSNLDRVLDRPFLKIPQPFVGLKSHFYGEHLPGRIHLYTFPGGYCGLSEIENGLMNVCLLVQQDVFYRECDHSTRKTTGFIDWMKTQNKALGAWLLAAQPTFKDWISIAQIPFVNKRPMVDDILMVGDSAGLIAPIAGDGMGMALQTSLMASKLVSHYLSEQISAKTLRLQYAAEWRRAFKSRLRLSRLLQTFMMNQRWLKPGLQLMNACPALSQYIVTHTRDSRLIQSKGKSRELSKNLEY